jgi:hypothetical protein
VTLFGAVTSALTALLLFAIERIFEFSLYTWTFWFVIPVGALLSGFAAATGYLWGAKLLNHRPGRALLVSMVAVSAGTFFLIHYMSYAALTAEGSQLRGSLTFPTYLNLVLTHASVSFRFHAAKLGETGQLGFLGYAYALLQVLGFAAGGFGVYLHLRELPFCEACSRYLKRTSRVHRFSDRSDELKGLSETIAPLLKAGRLSEVAAAHAAFGDPKAGKAHTLRAELSLWGCRTCTRNLVRFAVARKSDNDWKDVTEQALEGTSYSPVVTETVA